MCASNEPISQIVVLHHQMVDAVDNPQQGLSYDHSIVQLDLLDHNESV